MSKSEAIKLVSLFREASMKSYRATNKTTRFKPAKAYETERHYAAKLLCHLLPNKPVVDADISEALDL